MIISHLRWLEHLQSVDATYK